MKFSAAAALGLAVFSWGCAGGNAALRSTSVSSNISPPLMGGEKLTEMDLNRDKRPDVFVYSIEAKTEDGRTSERLVRREMDLNWDGRIDVCRLYDDGEQLKEERLDLDFDGRVDQVNFYEKGALVRKERDVEYTGKPNQWLYYEKGQLARKEQDTNGDGKVDHWEYWENGQLDRMGDDLDGDGKVDRWTKGATVAAE